MDFRLRTVMAILLARTVYAQDGRPAEVVSFERHVKPILRKRCGNCHATERPRGELDLSTYSGVVAGGASGKVAVAGKPEDSPIYTLPAHLEDPKMPPNAPKIPQREIDVLRRWVEGGLFEGAGESASTGGAPASEASVETLVAAELQPRGSAIQRPRCEPCRPAGRGFWAPPSFRFRPRGSKAPRCPPVPGRRCLLSQVLEGWPSASRRRWTGG